MTINVIPQGYPLFAVPIGYDSTDKDHYVHDVVAVIGWRADGDSWLPLTTPMSSDSAGDWSGENVQFEFYSSEVEANEAAPALKEQYAEIDRQSALHRAERNPVTPASRQARLAEEA